MSRMSRKLKNQKSRKRVKYPEHCHFSKLQERENLSEKRSNRTSDAVSSACDCCRRTQIFNNCFRDFSRTCIREHTRTYKRRKWNYNWPYAPFFPFSKDIILTWIRRRALKICNILINRPYCSRRHILWLLSSRAKSMRNRLEHGQYF